jgi:HSP20 family molecular chaperone IbpA
MKVLDNDKALAVKVHLPGVEKKDVDFPVGSGFSRSATVKEKQEAKEGDRVLPPSAAFAARRDASNRRCRSIAGRSPLIGTARTL